MAEKIDTVVVDGLALAETLRDEMAREIAAIVAGERPAQAAAEAIEAHLA